MNIEEKRYRFLSALVLVAYAMIHTFAIDAPWFPADDGQELAFVRTMDLTALFGVDAFGLFRPVKNLLFLIFSFLEPRGMYYVRLVAVAIGLLTFFPVKRFFRFVFPDRRYALLATAFWMLAPTLVSSVVWLSCVNIQLMCAFAALALVAHDRERPPLASLWLLLACLSYESAVAIGPCIVVFDFFLRPERFRDHRTWRQYALYAFVTIGFLLLRHAVGSVHAVNGNIANCSRPELILASAYLTCQHFLSWAWPFGRMTVFGGYTGGGVHTVILIGCWLLILATVVAAYRLRNRNPVIGFGIVFSLVAFLPVSNITGVGNGPYGDYYLGISSLGLAAAAAALCLTRIGLYAIPALRLAALAAAFHWAWLWADGDRAYFAAAENFPDFFGNRIILVKRLSEAGMWKEALQLGAEVEAVVGADSGQMAEVYVVRGLYELRVRKDAEAALRAFEKSRKTDDFGGAGRNRDFYIGCVYDDLLNDSERAEKCYASALGGKWTVDSVQVADRYARILAVRGDLKTAVSVWERALIIDPQNKSVRHNLSLARASLKGGK